MRRVGLVFLLCFGATAALWQLATDDGPGSRTTGDVATAPTITPARRGRLRIEGDVARAPDFEASATAPAVPEGQRVWVGRAVSRTSGEGVAAASVVLERIDPPGSWAQPRSESGGRFRVIAPPEALAAEAKLRVWIESADKESALHPLAVRDEVVVDVGEILLGGAGTLEGRVEEADGTPIRGVRIEALRFGRFALLPGTVASATSDKHGSFLLDRLPHGFFVLRGHGPRGRPFLASPVAVPQDGPLVLRARPAYAMHLRVATTLGDPVADAVVEIVPRGDGPVDDPLDPAFATEPFSARTDKTGAASLEHVPPGRFWILVHVPDGSRYEFTHVHAERVRRTLVLPAERVTWLRFFEQEPPPAETPTPPRWIAGATVGLSLEGACSIPGRRPATRAAGFFAPTSRPATRSRSNSGRSSGSTSSGGRAARSGCG